MYCKQNRHLSHLVLKPDDLLNFCNVFVLLSMEVFVKIPKKNFIMHQTDNKSFVIVYLNKVDFSPSQSFSVEKRALWKRKLEQDTW